MGYAELGLRRLLLGKDSTDLDPNSDDERELLQDVRKELPNSFKEPVPEQLRGVSHKSVSEIDIEGYVLCKKSMTLPNEDDYEKGVQQLDVMF